MKKNDLISNNTRWDGRNVKLTIQLGLFAYAWIGLNKAPKDSKRIAIYNNVHAKFDTTWGCNKL